MVETRWCPTRHAAEHSAAHYRRHWRYVEIRPVANGFEVVMSREPIGEPRQPPAATGWLRYLWARLRGRW